MTERPLTVSVVGFSPGFAYLDGLPGPLREVPRRDSAAARGSGRLGGARQRARRRLPDRVARRVAARRPHRLSPLLAGAAPVCRAGAGRPGPVHRGRVRATRSSPPRRRRRRGPRRRRPVGCSRSWRRVCAPSCRTAAGGRGRRRGPRAPGPPIRCPSPWPTGLSAMQPARAPWSSPVAAPGCAAWRPATSPSWAPRPRSRRRHAGAGRTGRASGAAGQQLEVGPLRRGCRTYLSVAGGFLGPEVFGSSASDELTGLGRRAAGTDGAPLTPARGPPRWETTSRPGRPPSSTRAARPWSCGSCRALIPSNSQPAALARLAAVAFRVERDSNRVGIRLRRGIRRGQPAAGREEEWASSTPRAS